MTTFTHRPPTSDDVREPQRRRRPRRGLVLLAGLVTAALVAGLLVIHHVRDGDLHRNYIDAAGWPERGQAALLIGDSARSSGGRAAVPIASLAKVMTAYLVLRALPLHGSADGPALVVTHRDTRDTARRRRDDQSVVPVHAGERLSERQALIAMLLPSANNVAVMLARHVAGSVPRFVRGMNAAAAGFGMTRTRYTDPSGFDEGTVSTARDQLTLARVMSRDETFGELVALTSYRLPVAGTVHNTNSLLGRDGFVGTKTGSDDAAGGCLMFRTYRVIGGRVTDVLGVVLGQRGEHDITAGITAARQLADQLGPAAGH